MSGRISSLELLDPRFADCLAQLMLRLKGEGIGLAVFESARSPQRQMELYAQGRDPARADYGRTVTRARGYQSAHQWGLAVDLAFYDSGRWSWQEPRSGDWARMHVLARAVGLHPLEQLEMPHVEMLGFDWRRSTPGPPDTKGWRDWLEARVT